MKLHLKKVDRKLALQLLMTKIFTKFAFGIAICFKLVIQLFNY